MSGCTRIQERLSDYTLGNMAEKEKNRIQRHLETCRHCRLEFEKYQNLDEMFMATRMVRPPGGMWEKIKQGITVKPPPEPFMIRLSNLLYKYKVTPRFAVITSLVLLSVLVSSIYFSSDRSDLDPDETPEFFIKQHYRLSLSEPLADQSFVLATLAEMEHEDKNR